MARVLPVTTVPIGQISRDPTNAYSHADADIHRLHGVIQEYGFLGALAVDQDFVLIGGEARLEVLTQLDYAEVPVNIVMDLAPEERTALAIALNAPFGEWNEDRLRRQLLDLKGRRFDLDLTGLRPFDITKALDLPGEKKDLETKPPQGTPDGPPILSFQVVFESEVEQTAFYQFARYLKEQYPDHATLGARITAYMAAMESQ